MATESVTEVTRLVATNTFNHKVTINIHEADETFIDFKHPPYFKYVIKYYDCKIYDGYSLCGDQGRMLWEKCGTYLWLKKYPSTATCIGHVWEEWVKYNWYWEAHIFQKCSYIILISLKKIILK